MASGAHLRRLFGGAIAVSYGIHPAIAHNIKTDGDVGATFHIEPNHNPRAGETAQAWFALTRPGGELISLEQCDCKLAVYSQSSADKSVILEPPLQGIDAEQYRGIPGADIVFPEAGAYALELRGRSKVEGAFQPFEFTYSVTVSPGKSFIEEASATAAANPTGNSEQPFSMGGFILAIASGLLLGLGGWWLLAQRSRFKRRSPRR